jgi:hypothetical protein
VQPVFAAIPEGIQMSQTNQPGKAAGKQITSKPKTAVIASGGKPAEPMLKPRRQTLPMKK